MIMMIRQVACFLVVSLMAFTAHADGAQTAARQSEKGRTTAVFAVSWLPGFCVTRPERAECKAQKPGGFDATHFTLHGLWPVGKSYCGVDAAVKAQDIKRKWLDLPRPELETDARVTLASAMPGVQSGLDRHQWVRSGRCHSPTADAYFKTQMQYLDVLNGSAVRSLFVERLGGHVKEQEIRQVFDRVFGRGAGDRVCLQCRKVGETTVVTGLTIGLGGGTPNLPAKAVSDVGVRASEGDGDNSDLSALILAADASDGKCPTGLIQSVDAR